ncbi:MAG: hypothetical protein QXY89_07190 [Zestosphaera sp.]
MFINLIPQEFYESAMRVRLIKKVTKDRRIGREYVGYVINLPKSVIESLNFASSEYLELEVRVIDGRQCIVIYKP